MSARLIVTDSGSVERELQRLVVIDSGSVAREIQKLWVIDSGSVARLVFRRALLLEDLTIGTDATFDTWYGFRDTGLAPFGSMTGDTWTDLSSVARDIGTLAYNATQQYLALITDDGNGGADNDNIFRELVVNGNSFLRSAADFHNLSGGNHQWRWNTASNPIGTSGTIPARIKA